METKSKKNGMLKRNVWILIFIVVVIAVVAVVYKSKSGEPATNANGGVSYNSSSNEIAFPGGNYKMVCVEGGTFDMGCNDSESSYGDSPVHSVTVGDYYIGETEVTQALWKAVMGDNPSSFVGDDLPVECVSWEDCQLFISNLNSMTGKNFRMPTEAEWEFAARGGNKSKHTKYSGSDNIDDVEWYWRNSGDKYLNGTDWDVETVNNNNCKMHPVATKQPNELGIYDMGGNVCEWCSDWYGVYLNSSQTNPTGPSEGSCRVFRGGCWSDDANRCCVSIRNNVTPDLRSSNIGFRLALIP